ncbi:hypothetical protein ENSA5_49810 [Enhygromyxa salina]|uniref:Dickkopf N-terminal cysteine-rich domain-containing protein n=1 Tax=Enhygromyxa salina TaxID=215803 RepID=A0A2S9XHZ7_9BACT|nr:Dickkopf N-terminal cysteine-rich domain-containing protein [Enhygromyxa salina]PRP92350.1 hypothetical protein ENSA5_49810 [Enhygromyxa salina]
MRSIIPMTLCVCLSAILGCNASLGSEAGSSGETGESSEAGEDGGEYVPCSADNACPDGQFCFNGLCAVGCLSDADCGDDQYCATDTDMLCHNNEVPTCVSDSDCASSQVCVNGFCSAAPDAQDSGCNLDDYINDGCPSNAVCLEDIDDPEVGVCYEMPACSVDGACPVGLEGAVCNDGYLPSKDAICLIGLCETVSDCPAQWSCVHFNQSVLGTCSDGGFGSPCATGADCQSGNCTELPGLGGGFCG